MVEVILKKNITKLGDRNEIVKVKNGYGNYLISSQIAVLANKSNKKNLVEILKQANSKEAKIISEAKALGKKLDRIQLIFSEKVDEGGKLFGTITPLKIANAYKEHQVVLTAKKINILNTPIKEVGMHQAEVTLHKDVKKIIFFKVKKGD